MTELMSNIKAAMDSKKISQAELADKIGKHRASVNKWFTRDNDPKTIDAVKIASALNTTVEQLVSGDISIDPAEMYLKKLPGLRSLVISLGLHPELIDHMQGYLAGYMEKQGYNLEDDKKEAMTAG